MEGWYFSAYFFHASSVLLFSSSSKFNNVISCPSNGKLNDIKMLARKINYSNSHCESFVSTR